MPRKKEPEPLLNINIRLFAADYERLKVLYPQHGPARVIRTLVHTHVLKIDRKVNPLIIDDVEIELNMEDADA